jgi:hypothetical protein
VLGASRARARRVPSAPQVVLFLSIEMLDQENNQQRNTGHHHEKYHKEQQYHQYFGQAHT